MSSEQKERSGGLLWAAGLVALAACLYVLSIGPVVMTWQWAGWDAAPLRTLYAPVIWLHDHTAVRVPLEWYVNLWGVR